ncbi:elongation factor G [Maridesulfovibrio hydrothermalis]|uniref:Elongation factor G n=1 Tax=Maridesulfovibrio hydrothermalis AM13 = DSM 14728 TaxID=1121451 RepID=L0RCA8_9BACT|nr:elongation factor G [Maridesulfovibrio hydrothermalis]CCO24398.1 Elongation factor G 2 [Maridesulfovibrio hydrothermalis AM13 = DSM 14728]
MNKKPDFSARGIGRIRNIGIIAHIDAGKTTVTERMLYFSGKIHRLGEVHEGTATMDYMPEEQDRGITITSAVTTCYWGQNTINIIDTPGHVDFTIEVERSLRVLDGAVGVFCAVGGVEPQSETVWRQSEGYSVPKLVFINKMDRLGADFEAVLESMSDKLSIKSLPVQVPDGGGDEFSAVYDLIRMKKLVFNQEENGEVFEAFDLTEQDEDFVTPWREGLCDALSEVDDEFMERYLEDDIDPDYIESVIRKATLNLELVPVFAGSALKNIGVQPLMDGVGKFLPSPLEAPEVTGFDPDTGVERVVEASVSAPFQALAFKILMDAGRKMVLMRIYSGRIEPGDIVQNFTQRTTERIARLFRMHAGRKESIDVAGIGDIVAVAGLKDTRTGDTLSLAEKPLVLENIGLYKPVISLAIEPRNADESEKLEEVLAKYLQEDPTLELGTDEATGQIILSGMGELHLEVVLDRLRREYKLDPRAGNPQVVYQEVPGGKAEAEEEFDKVLGEEKHYGFVRLAVEPLERGAGQDIVFEIDTALWSAEWMDAVAEGIDDGLQSGVIKGFPVQDIKVRVLEMRKKDGESSVPGYHMAAGRALKEALTASSPKLMEPIMDVEISVPEEFVGEVIGLLGSKGARIENMISRNRQKIVQALSPLRNMFGFSTELRSSTQGRAGFAMKFHSFDVLD